MAPATQPPTGSTPPSHGDRDCRRTDVAGKIHGYYAAATFADAQIGKVLDELHKLGLEKNTRIVLWGDHGIWTKPTNYEQATRIPLLVIAPGATPPGSVSKQPVESVDIFPTLAELAALPAPRGPQAIDGLSRVPVLCDPAKIIRDPASHCYPRGPFMAGPSAPSATGSSSGNSKAPTRSKRKISRPPSRRSSTSSAPCSPASQKRS